jgi:DUF4097 and DUF4098 domain-containing protein YvlB
MKKLFTLLFAIGTVTIASAQSGFNRNGYDNDRRYNENIRSDKNDKWNDQRGYDRNNDRDYNRGYDRGYNERKRQEEAMRIRREYDMKIQRYRNDRHITTYERNKRIVIIEKERDNKLRSVLGGAAVGAVAGAIIGAIIAH